MKLSKSLLCAALLLTAGTSQAQETKNCYKALGYGQTGSNGRLDCETDWVYKRSGSNKVHINAWSYDMSTTGPYSVNQPATAYIHLNLGFAWESTGLVYGSQFTGYHGYSAYFNNTAWAPHRQTGHFKLYVTRGNYTHGGTTSVAKVKGIIATD